MNEFPARYPHWKWAAEYIEQTKLQKIEEIKLQIMARNPTGFMVPMPEWMLEEPLPKLPKLKRYRSIDEPWGV